MIAVTFAEVVLRAFGHPIIGSYEIISFLGAMILGFTIPQTSMKNGHVFVEFLVDRLGMRKKAVVYAITRIIGVCVFFVLGLFFIFMARDLYVNGDVSPTLKVSYSPIAAGLGVACFMEIFVMVTTAVKAFGGTHE
jgi:TRAP-type C4-dicarboxylate transport system permease small subunit